MKKHAVRIGLGLVLLVILLGHAARAYDIRFVQQLDAIIYDYRLRLTMPQTVDDRVVILDIDEKSLAEEGRWPWRRDRLALLIDTLFDKYHIAVVGFDVVFAEKDESSGLRVLQELAQNQLRDVPKFTSTLNQLRPQLEFDQVFANRIKGRPVILGYYFSTAEGGGTQSTTSGALPQPVLAPGTFQGRPIAFTIWDGYGGNLPELMAAAAGAGHFNPLTDFDGVTRRVPMLAEYQGAYYESLSLAMVRALLGFPPVTPGLVSDPGAAKDYGGLESIELKTDMGTLTIPVDQNVSTLIPYRGRQGSFKYISVSDVLRDRVPPEDLQGKVVLVGTTAPGLLDLRATPVAAVFPGVEVHANLIAGILDQNLKLKPPYVLGAEVVLLLLSGLFLALVLPLLNPLKATITTLVVAFFVLSSNLMVWHYGHLVLPMATGVILILGMYLINVSYGYFVEARSKRQITGLFGRYVSPALVDEMAKNPEQVSMEGESREMSVLFTDVRGFTTISEGMEPKELSKLMNEFLTPLTQLIYDHRGTVDKYMGDCIMAFWGAPLADSDHARHAVEAGLHMQARLAELRLQFQAKGWPEVRIGVGVNSGVMRVGNMGSQMRVAYTVMGDAVNLASRMEGITKEYGVGMIVGDVTRKTVPDFVFRELDQVRVKGKNEPVPIFEPIGPAGEVPKEKLEELKIWHQALKYYRAQDWDRAEMQLLNLKRMAPEVRLYDIYAERTKEYRAEPPGEGWDGVYTFKHK
ncbi:MAG: adenylate/guanylate cyclase domain-containing protein [Betaproteobacteria bacterium]|nr:adenylate/guanylate cyclase domain-containing protein [Betaproteobacteria bacterium]